MLIPLQRMSAYYEPGSMLGILHTLSLLLKIILRGKYLTIFQVRKQAQKLNYLLNAKHLISGLTGIQTQCCPFKSRPFIMYSHFLCMLG